MDPCHGQLGLGRRFRPIVTPISSPVDLAALANGTMAAAVPAQRNRTVYILDPAAAGGPMS